MISKSGRETQSLAKNLVESLTEPKVIALYGELGTGKTTFVQGLAKTLGIEKRVLSPTFVFVRSYSLRDPRFKIFHHVDLYRAESLEAARSVGIEEILASGSLVAIEWPEIIEELLPKNTVRVRFKKVDESKREISVF
ncbi:MAG TPA: tRNA (adenosine(37)-N6)-threonylcarbamoyltransferase complex ATPase subunit type 1 TsaE [Candidatus Nanoarchaeia archaeon]|nr:tRNA threonylcarbamoyladenosine biosynthesis protein TsaE [uncultured archaeon]